MLVASLHSQTGLPETSQGIPRGWGQGVCETTTRRTTTSAQFVATKKAEEREKTKPFVSSFFCLSKPLQMLMVNHLASYSSGGNDSFYISKVLVQYLLNRCALKFTWIVKRNRNPPIPTGQTIRKP